MVETLEDRRLLSVSARTLAGAEAVTGTVSTFKTVSGSTVLLTAVQTVLGPTTFQGHKAFDTLAVGGPPGEGTTTTTHSYASVNTAGWLVYGSTGMTQNGGAQSTDMSTYAPPEVYLPGTMEAGTPYHENTTYTEQVTTATGTTMIVTQVATTLTLEAAKQSIQVPAGRYKAYVVDETMTLTVSTTIDVDGNPFTTTSGPATTTAKRYFAPKVGLVDYVIDSGDQFELVSQTHRK